MEAILFTILQMYFFDFVFLAFSFASLFQALGSWGRAKKKIKGDQEKKKKHK